APAAALRCRSGPAGARCRRPLARRARAWPRGGGRAAPAHRAARGLRGMPRGGGGRAGHRPRARPSGARRYPRQPGGRGAALPAVVQPAHAPGRAELPPRPGTGLRRHRACAPSHARRRYADAMLNVQLAVPGLPVGCHWQSSQSLKERILMLKRIQPGPGRRKAGLIVIGLLLVTCSYAAWAVRPAPTPAPTVASAPEAPSPPPAAPAPPAVPVPGELPAAPPPPPPPPPAPLAPPRYPAEAAAAGQGGRVVMKLLVGVDGRVRDVVVEHSEPAGVFDAAAVEA